MFGLLGHRLSLNSEDGALIVSFLHMYIWKINEIRYKDMPSECLVSFLADSKTCNGAVVRFKLINIYMTHNYLL